MYLYKIMLIVSITMCLNLWKAVCSETNIPFFRKFYLGYYFALKIGVACKRLTYKIRANSNFNTDQSNFPAN